MQIDLISLLQQLGVLIAGSGGLWAITELVKRSPKIPAISDGKKVQIRAFLALLAGVGVIVSDFVDGKVDPVSVRSTLVDLFNFVALIAGAHSIHKAVSK